jgi:tetratricopeptide (TPR) repeat protein
LAEAQQVLIERIKAGQRLAQLGQFVAAAELFQSLLDGGATDPAISVELGYALKDAGQGEAASKALQQALRLAPDNIRLLNAHGLVLTDLRRLEEALEAFDKACQADPKSAGSLGNLARTLLSLGRAKEAAMAAQQALMLDGGLIPVLQTLRAALFEAGQIDAGVSLCEKLASDPGASDATLGLRATCCEDLGRHRQALELWLRFAQTGGGGDQAVFNAALAALRLEDYPLGWQLWSKRAIDRRRDLSSQNMDVPYWTGKEPLAGRSLFIYPEQGFGDCIQFARYLTQLDALGPRQLTLAFPKALEPLYRNMDSVRVLRQGEAVGQPDLQCSVASLPCCLLAARGTIEIPAPLPPRLDQAKVRFWSDLLGPRIRPRLGIATSGNPEHHNDRNRSIALELLRPLASAGFELICLQRELRDSDQSAARQMGLQFRGSQIEDFGDAAALASLCERVVSVDSAPAHLAGSMGIETLVLLPALADWRWGVARERSVWYPSVRLFRQDQRRDWGIPIAQLMKALRVAG